MKQYKNLTRDQALIYVSYVAGVQACHEVMGRLVENNVDGLDCEAILDKHLADMMQISKDTKEEKIDFSKLTEVDFTGNN